MIFMLFNKFTFQATVITDAVLSTCEQKAVYTQTPTKKKKTTSRKFYFWPASDRWQKSSYIKDAPNR